MDLIIKNCNIINEDKTDFNCFIYIRNGIIESFGKMENLPDIKAENAIDANGLYASFGFLDMHTHLRDPGFEYKEDNETGSMAALHGGFTTILAMPNTNPVNDNVKTTEYIINKAKKAGGCKVLPIGAATINSDGNEPTDMKALRKAGAAAFSDDGRPIMNSGIALKAMAAASEAGSFVISHCEDLNLSDRATTRSAEEVMIARECVLSYEYNLPVHIAHVSTKAGVEIIRLFKRLGAKVTAETCPHYFSLTQDDIKALGANAKMNPPLRTEEDVKAIIDGLKDKTIDVIATDHAPHSKEEKEREFERAPNGIIGLETAFSVSVTYLVKTKTLTLNELIGKMAARPYEILGLPYGIKKNNAADLVLFSPDEKVVYRKENLKSKAENSPFLNKELSGRIYMTIVGGEIKYNGLKQVK